MSRASANRQSRGRILVVDDNETNRVMLDSILSTKSYAVDHAEDGSSAISAVKRSRYDVILMDIQMPGMSGFETARAMRRWQGGRLEFVILGISSGLRSEHKELALESGMNGIIDRPNTAATLVRQVEYHVPCKANGPKHSQVVWRRSAYGQAMSTMGHAKAQTALLILAASLQGISSELRGRFQLKMDRLPELAEIMRCADRLGFDEVAMVAARIYDALFELKPRSYAEDMMGACDRANARISDFIDGGSDATMHAGCRFGGDEGQVH